MVSDRTDGRSNPTAQKPPRKFQLRDPEEALRRTRRNKWALAIVTLAVAGTLATIGIQYLKTQLATAESYRLWMLDDLERLVEAQTVFHDTNDRFASDGELGVAFVPSQGVHIVIEAADETGWHAVATHMRSEKRCVVTVGTGPSALRNLPSGNPTCRVP